MFVKFALEFVGVVDEVRGDGLEELAVFVGDLLELALQLLAIHRCRYLYPIIIIYQALQRHVALRPQGQALGISHHLPLLRQHPLPPHILLLIQALPTPCPRRRQELHRAHRYPHVAVSGDRPFLSHLGAD